MASADTPGWRKLGAFILTYTILGVPYHNYSKLIYTILGVPYHNYSMLGHRILF